MTYKKDEIREKYKDLFEQTLDLIYVFDLKGNFLDANDAALRSLGYTIEDINNLSFGDLIDTIQLKKAFTQLNETLTTGGQSTLTEYELKSKTGNTIYVETIGIPLKENNEIYAVLGIARDISERKKAEKQLKASEEKYRHLFESSPFLIGILDLEGNILDINIAVNDFLTSRTRDDLIGKNIREIFSIQEEEIPIIPIILDQIKRNVNGETTESFEFPLVRSNKSIQWISLNSSLINIEDQTLIQFIGQDITDEKKAEQKLKESEIKFRHLFESSPYSIGLLDLNGNLIACNSATSHFLSIHKIDDYLGKNFKEIFSLNEKNKAHITSLAYYFKKILEGDKNESIEFPLYRSAGGFIWVNLRGSLIKIGNKTLVQFIAQDITERKRAELLIQEEFEKLKELEQIRKDLISRVSHELKTPLIPVISGSELLTTVYKDQIGKEALEIIQMINKGGSRLKELVAKLLNVSRIEDNKMEVKKEKLNLSELIRESSQDMKYLLINRKLSLNLNLPEALYLNIDKKRIGEVITNLLSNAINNTPPNGKIDISLWRQEDWVIFSVSDTGIGLTKKEMNLLFTRFGKIERFGEGLEYVDRKGSGLGLYICKEIIDLHGGHIWAESGGRKMGSTFTVKLPIL
ncbi:MAG: PAS domain S-box protein [Candidatus Hodarchaeota archaeon]